MWEFSLKKVIDLLGYDATQPLLFNSGLFLILFIIFYSIYALLSGRRTIAIKMLYVTAFSYYFYYKNAGAYSALLAVITLGTYFITLLMDRSHSSRVRRIWLWIAVGSLLGQLAFFKYTNFLLSAIGNLSKTSWETFDIFLPLGISFFTFQSLSYIIDVYRKKMKATRNILDLAFFVSFFPTLLSGPILRACEFLPQARRSTWISREMFGTGLWFIICGLLKKSIISDYIGENFVNRIFDNPALYTGLENLIGVYGYALKLYCDFSGYSDIAIGIALWMGFNIPANFRAPYKAESITDFWRRWHISLSSWLRDYLYISLGGNRRGRMWMYVNLFITMLLGGLWHGASWNFIIWGSLHGLALCLHKAYRRAIGHDKHYHSQGFRRLGAQLLTFHMVCLCWLFFANSTFDFSLTMLTQITTNFHGELLLRFIDGYPMVTALIVIGFLLHFLPTRWNKSASSIITYTPLPLQVLIFTLLLFIISQVHGSEVQPFIYLQF